MPKILNLTIKKEWFDLIASGKKKLEYRAGKEYWRKRLYDKNSYFRDFDEVHFRNGYGRNDPFMRVEFNGTELLVGHDDGVFEGDHGEQYRIGDFGIHLGTIYHRSSGELPGWGKI